MASSTSHVTTIKTTRRVESPTVRTYTPVSRTTAVITRTSLAQVPADTNKIVKSSRSVEYKKVPTHPKVDSAGVAEINEGRETEKKDLQGLNDRLAAYIEKVRFLEAQNRKLAAELDELRSKWGSESANLKAQYETELKEARDKIDGIELEKARLEIKIRSLEEEIAEIKQRVDDLLREHAIDEQTIAKQEQQLADIEPNLNMMRNRINQLEDERDRDKKTLQKLQQDLDKARVDLDNATLQHIDAENRRQTIEEEIEFLKKLHEQEVKEMEALIANPDDSITSDYWKNEMAQCIRDIQNEYNTKYDTLKNLYDAQYEMKINSLQNNVDQQGKKVNNMKNDNKTLRIDLTDIRNKLGDQEKKNRKLEKEYKDMLRRFDDKQKDWDEEKIKLVDEINALRDELDELADEIGILSDKKLSLELEIAAYRKMMDVEEDRISKQDPNNNQIYGDSNSADTLGGDDKSRGRSPRRGGRQGDGAVDDDDTASVASEKNATPGRKAFQQVMSGELAAKTQQQRTAKGHIQIGEVDPNGRFVQIENTGIKEENLSGWKIRRVVDKKREYIYTFPDRTTLGVGRRSGSLRVWSRKAEGKPQMDNYNYEFEGKTWGMPASQALLFLTNDRGEERATHTTKVTYG